MKTTSAIVLLGFLGLLAGCSTSTPEPSPGKAETPAPVAVNGNARVLGTHATDVIAQQIFARPAVDLPNALVQHHTVLPSTERLGDAYAAPETTHTDILHIAPRGVAGVYKVPVDTIDADTMLFLSPQVDGHDAIQAALRDVEVLDPNGQRVNARVSKGTDAPTTEMTSIPLAGHPTGTYTVRFKSGAPAVGLAIEARMATSKIVMKLKPSGTQHLLGNQTFVDATLMDGATPITGAHVVADLFDGENGNKVVPIAFTEVGNGVYRAQVHSVLTDAHKVGAYLTDVRADGTTASGTPFFRHGRTGFHYGIATARVTGVGAQRVITDDKGFISAFEVDVNLDSKSYDRLEVSAKLAVVGSDGEEHAISVAHTGQGLGAGSHTLTLRFDAGTVRLTKSEGNFYIRDLQMFSLGTNTLFHRQISGQNHLFPNVARAKLAPLAQLTPAQSQLVADGVLSND